MTTRQLIRFLAGVVIAGTIGGVIVGVVAAMAIRKLIPPSLTMDAVCTYEVGTITGSLEFLTVNGSPMVTYDGASEWYTVRSYGRCQTS